jgi:hypothetical protein
MIKVLNILSIILILIFSLSIYKYYASIKNLKTIDFNRNNIDKILNKKISNLPVLTNDTNNIIEFNNSLSKELTNDKSRSFWNLLKSK